MGFPAPTVGALTPEAEEASSESSSIISWRGTVATGRLRVLGDPVYLALMDDAARSKEDNLFRNLTKLILMNVPLSVSFLPSAQNYKDVIQTNRLLLLVVTKIRSYNLNLALTRQK